VNFVHIQAEKNILEYRCFERGINKETLACGTGALAVSFVARRLNLINAKQITVWPHRSRWYDADAFILIDQNKNRWTLYGKPALLLEGKFMLEKYLSEQIAALQSKDSNQNQSYQIQEENEYHSASMNY
jgi:diaminopimelate epimerase